MTLRKSVRRPGQLESERLAGTGNSAEQRVTMYETTHAEVFSTLAAERMRFLLRSNVASGVPQTPGNCGDAPSESMRVEDLYRCSPSLQNLYSVATLRWRRSCKRQPGNEGIALCPFVLVDWLNLSRCLEPNAALAHSIGQFRAFGKVSRKPWLFHKDVNI